MHIPFWNLFIFLWFNISVWLGDIFLIYYRWVEHSEKVDRSGWLQCTDIICNPSWDRPHEVDLHYLAWKRIIVKKKKKKKKKKLLIFLLLVQIMFRKPIVILPGSTCAIYIHSSLPDDLGLQYQSYRRGDVVADDEHLTIFPGLGHTVSSTCYFISIRYSIIVIIIISTTVIIIVIINEYMKLFCNKGIGAFWWVSWLVSSLSRPGRQFELSMSSKRLEYLGTSEISFAC